MISYTDADAQALKVAKCHDPACAALTTISVVDDPAGESVTDSTSIRIGAGGMPLIGYFTRDTVATLKVAVCANPACTGATTIRSLHTLSPGTDGRNSLAVGADGFPIIAFTDGSPNWLLKVSKCSTPDCAGVTTTSVLGPGGSHASISIPADGLPVISHGFRDPPLSWRVSKCSSASCNALTSDLVLDYASQGQNTSLAIGADGFPIISSEGIKFVKCNTSSCQ